MQTEFSNEQMTRSSLQEALASASKEVINVIDGLLTKGFSLSKEENEALLVNGLAEKQRALIFAYAAALQGSNGNSVDLELMFKPIEAFNSLSAESKTWLSESIGSHLVVDLIVSVIEEEYSQADVEVLGEILSTMALGSKKQLVESYSDNVRLLALVKGFSSKVAQFATQGKELQNQAQMLKILLDVHAVWNGLLLGKKSQQFQFLRSVLKDSLLRELEKLKPESQS